MLTKGVKRKRSESDDSMDGVSHISESLKTSAKAAQSNFLLNMSLYKLHQSLAHVEPNLRHLVLVANTLRLIQEEAQLEQTRQAIQKDPETALRAKPLSSPETGVPRSGEPSGLQNSETDASRKLPPAAAESQRDEILLPSFDGPFCSTVSTIFQDLDHLDGISNLRCSPQLKEDHVSPLAAGSPVEQHKHDAGGASNPLLGCLEILSSNSCFLEDTPDDIFEDIDTSMYDYDPWSPVGLLNFKPLSVTDNSPVRSPTCEQNGRSDLNDLDHLMDILVGTETC
ncbi:SERTA domain-containing protein 1 [Latimeria chalumnae]|uniref:SERTA domain-containing protein 1 n=1 Tax=Latimeria chalumnae TaxID=7897 RepID=UPI0003C19751|nr:PREDICTED: SERTA domain-containing protein 1 [Latimeria chalumnae]|eukprot:XP_005991677.1 PREDICTED: SERTA domain-containing protein 1 [Latimeria chalumnae]